MRSNHPSDYRDVVEAHKHDSTLFIAAIGDPCRGLAKRLKDKVPKPRQTKHGAYGRNVQVPPVNDLNDEKPRSWSLALLHCGGDESLILKWAKKVAAKDRSRVRFYLHNGVNVPAEWPDSLAESPAITTENGTLKMLLAQLNDQTYKDYAPNKAPGIA